MILVREARLRKLLPMLQNYIVHESLIWSCSRHHGRVRATNLEFNKLFCPKITLMGVHID